jgi:hypothetical protein
MTETNWPMLAPLVRSLTNLLQSAVEASSEGDASAQEFIAFTYSLTESRIELMKENLGIDITDPETLFVFFHGFYGGMYIMHSGLHALEWLPPADEDEPCFDLMQATVGWLLPLLPLLPLELILVDEGGPLDFTEVEGGWHL